jgi:hypothetical protein
VTASASTAPGETCPSNTASIALTCTGGEAPDGGAEASPGEGGCVTPASPGFVDCPYTGNGGGYAECKRDGQYCCNNFGCYSSGSGFCDALLTQSHICDSPEDCDGGECHLGIMCAPNAPSCDPDPGCGGTTSTCLCHSDQDCAGTGFPFCAFAGSCANPNVRGYPVCQRAPSPDAGATGSCASTVGLLPRGG